MRRNVVTAAFTVSILSLLAPDARALEHAWSRQYTGTGTQHVAAVAADFNGNIYAAAPSTTRATSVAPTAPARAAATSCW